MFRKKNRPLLQQQQGKNGKTTTEDDALQVLESSNAKDAATTNNKNKNAARAKSPPPKTRKKQQQQQQVPQQTKSFDSQDNNNMKPSGPAVIRTSSLISSSSTKSGRRGGKQAQSKSQPANKSFPPNPPNGDPLFKPVRTVVWQAGSFVWQECRKENDHRLVGLLCQCPSLLFSCVCVCFSRSTCLCVFCVRDLGNGSLCDSFVFSTGSIRLVLFWFLAPVPIRWLEWCWLGLPFMLHNNCWSIDDDCPLYDSFYLQTAYLSMIPRPRAPSWSANSRASNTSLA